MVFSSSGFEFGVVLCIQLLLLIIIEAAIDLQVFITCSNDRGYYTTGSVYQKNLNDFLSSLVTNKSSNGHGLYNSSFGQDDDIANKVYSVALCRPDLKPDASLNLVKDLAYNLTRACPNHKEAIIWNYYCMLRYSNRSFNDLELSPSYNYSTTQNISSSDVDSFNQELKELIGGLKNQAAVGGLEQKFATLGKRVMYSNTQTIFGLVQCIPDLTEEQCGHCLDEGLSRLQQCCYGMDTGRYGNPSCNLRYEVYNTSDPASLKPLAPPPANATRSSQAIRVLSMFLTKLLTEDLPRLFVCPKKIVLDFQKGKAVGPVGDDFKPGDMQEGNKDFVGNPTLDGLCVVASALPVSRPCFILELSHSSASVLERFEEHIFELKGNKYGEWNVVGTQKQIAAPAAIVDAAEPTSKGKSFLTGNYRFGSLTLVVQPFSIFRFQILEMDTNKCHGHSMSDPGNTCRI